MAGLEPARLTPTDFKSAVYTNSTTLARLKGPRVAGSLQTEGLCNQGGFITHRYSRVNLGCRIPHITSHREQPIDSGMSLAQC